jgi:hypothetical protein
MLHLPVTSLPRGMALVRRSARRSSCERCYPASMDKNKILREARPNFSATLGAPADGQRCGFSRNLYLVERIGKALRSH